MLIVHHTTVNLRRAWRPTTMRRLMKSFPSRFFLQYHGNLKSARYGNKLTQSISSRAQRHSISSTRRCISPTQGYFCGNTFGSIGLGVKVVSTARCYFRPFSESPPAIDDLTDKHDNYRGRRLWKATQADNSSENQFLTSANEGVATNFQAISSDTSNRIYWNKAVDDVHDRRIVEDSLSRIRDQERVGGRMRQSQLGVVREDPHEDMRLLLENYTAPALAAALRDREDTLQLCANLLSQNRIKELSKILSPYETMFIEQRRHSKGNVLDFRNGGFSPENIELIRKGLNRMPRRVSTAHSKRAGVVLPLCNVDGIPCLLFEKRSARLRAHPDEVCLPGGMVSEGGDKSIVQTCLREMEEEIGISHTSASVLGVLRCNWGEVHHLVGVAVTPVVCYIGEVGLSQLNPNPNEVAECFTVPLELFLDRDSWAYKKHFAPFFTGAPHIIWGLTGYIVNRFVKDIIEPYTVIFNDTST